MPLDSPAPAPVSSAPGVSGAPGSHGAQVRAPLGPARAAVARVIREQGASLLRLRRVAVYLPGVLGAPRLLATSPATGVAPEPDDAPEAGVSPLRLAAVRAASGPSTAPFEVELGASRGEPRGSVLVVPLDGAGWLVAQRDEGWPPEERACALALARAVQRIVVGVGAAPGGGA